MQLWNDDEQDTGRNPTPRDSAHITPLHNRYDEDVVKVYKRACNVGADARYWLQYRYDKKTWKIYSDSAGNAFSSERTARKLAAVIDYEIADKVHNPYKYQTATNKLWLFKNQIIIWLNGKYKTCKPSTTRSYESYIRLHILPYFGELDVSEIKAYHGLQFLDKLPATMQPKSRKEIFTILNGFFNHCARADIINKPPAMPRIQVPERVIRWADYETQEKVRAHIPEQHKPIVHFAMRHGMRIGEVLGLMEKDLDFKLNTITIQRSLASYGLTTTKTGRVRVIPMNDELVETLRGLCAEKLHDAFVFTFRGKPYSRNTLYKTATRAARKVGLKISAYELFRHSKITQAAVLEVSPLVIQQYSGHTSFNTTKKYLNMSALSLVSMHTKKKEVIPITRAIGEGIIASQLPPDKAK